MASTISQTIRSLKLTYPEVSKEKLKEIEVARQTLDAEVSRAGETVKED